MVDQLRRHAHFIQAFARLANLWWAERARHGPEHGCGRRDGSSERTSAKFTASGRASGTTPSNAANASDDAAGWRVVASGPAGWGFASDHAACDATSGHATNHGQEASKAAKRRRLR